MGMMVKPAFVNPKLIKNSGSKQKERPATNKQIKTSPVSGIETQTP